jgi:hypothetical protein
VAAACRGNPIVQTEPSAQLLIALLRAQLGTTAEPGAEQFARCDWEYRERLAAHHGVVVPTKRSI